jgi:2-hydroxycyclohexanecarboxyl-CoA dehydrogenase
MDFTGKKIVITGSGSGIGKKTAEKFLEQGAWVVISDINEKVLAQAEKELRSKGKVVGFIADVCQYDAMESLAKKAIETLGGVDIWLNNAGTGTNKLFLAMTKEEWDFDIGINLYGVLNGCKAILPHMIEKKGGKIVNTVSDAGRIGEYKLSVYSAAKAGVIGFTKALAKEVGRYNILVNCVSLGTTKTDEIKKFIADQGPGTEEAMSRLYVLRRLGEEEDAANALMLMSSDYVTWITGQILSSSGGYSFVG